MNFLNATPDMLLNDNNNSVFTYILTDNTLSIIQMTPLMLSELLFPMLCKGQHDALVPAAREK
jgi:hypothetical protein